MLKYEAHHAQDKESLPYLTRAGLILRHDVG